MSKEEERSNGTAYARKRKGMARTEGKEEAMPWRRRAHEGQRNTRMSHGARCAVKKRVNRVEAGKYERGTQESKISINSEIRGTRLQERVQHTKTGKGKKRKENWNTCHENGVNERNVVHDNANFVGAEQTKLITTRGQRQIQNRGTRYSHDNPCCPT